MTGTAWGAFFIGTAFGLGVGMWLGWDTACWEVRRWFEQRRCQRVRFDEHVVDSMSLANFERDDEGLYARTVSRG